MSKVYRKILFMIFLSIILIPKVYAGATVSIPGVSVTQGDKFSVNINMSGSETMYSLGGILSYDGGYLTFHGCSSTGKFSMGNITSAGKIGLLGNGVSGGTVATCSFTANKVGSTSIRINNLEVNDDKGGKMSVSFSGGSVNIAAPKSRNANLKSLSVSNCSINFSAGNTSYSCSVAENVTSVNVSASAEDGGASVSGTGNKNLNYGNNKISVTVKAPAGNTNTYTINVTRKDNRSGENQLSSLTISDGNLSPGFSSGNTSYSIEVPYSVSSLNIKANTKDSKASVKIENNNLTAEETTEVKIIVTAENGERKTYTISAKRGKDPNKVLNTDNNLVSLTTDLGILSPAFDSNNTNYAIYLPYEVEKINLTYEVSDKKYAVVNFNGPESLGVGNNIYTISVKAEDETEKVYTINVVRAKILNGESSTNALLASLTMQNATLTEKFDSGVHLYYYNTKSKKDILVNAIAQNPEAVITYLEAGAGVYAVLVSAPSGNMSVYIMLPIKSKTTIIIIIAVITILLLAAIIFIIKKIKKVNPDKESKKDKKNKKHKKESEE